MPGSTTAATRARLTDAPPDVPVEQALAGDAATLLAISNAARRGDMTLREMQKLVSGPGSAVFYTRDTSRNIDGFVTVLATDRIVLVENLTFGSQPPTEAGAKALLITGIGYARTKFPDSLVSVQTGNLGQPFHMWMTGPQALSSCGTTFSMPGEKLVAWLKHSPTSGKSFVSQAQPLDPRQLELVQLKFSGVQGISIRGSRAGERLAHGSYLVEAHNAPKKGLPVSKGFCVAECGDGVLRLTDFFLPDDQSFSATLRSLLVPFQLMMRADQFARIEIPASGNPGIIGERLKSIGFDLDCRTYIASAATLAVPRLNSVLVPNPEGGVELPIPRRATPQDHRQILRLSRPLDDEADEPAYHANTGETFLVDDGKGTVMGAYRLTMNPAKNTAHVELLLHDAADEQQIAGLVSSFLLKPFSRGLPRAAVHVHSSRGDRLVQSVLTKNGYSLIGNCHVIPAEMSAATGSSRPWKEISSEFTDPAAADANVAVTFGREIWDAARFKEELTNPRVKLLEFAVAPGQLSYVLVEYTDSGPAFRRIIPAFGTDNSSAYHEFLMLLKEWVNFEQAFAGHSAILFDQPGDDPVLKEALCAHGAVPRFIFAKTENIPTSAVTPANK